ncbi:MAG TPA: hypothetical protein P5150_07510 [Candidatus Ratteibacteria bacterium]|nr:hypothetical protein [Candidatus Ratteibacteria bacterium]
MIEDSKVILNQRFFRGAWLHLQEQEFLREYCRISGRIFFNVTAFNVLTRRHPIVGYVNAYLYSPEIIRSFTEEDANELRFWMRSKGYRPDIRLFFS